MVYALYVGGLVLTNLGWYVARWGHFPLRQAQIPGKVCRISRGAVSQRNWTWFLVPCPGTTFRCSMVNGDVIPATEQSHKKYMVLCATMNCGYTGNFPLVVSRFGLG